MLWTPARHEPLSDQPWSESRARTAIRTIVEHTEAGIDGRTGLWPLHPNDLEPGVEHPLRSLYGGAAGLAWGLRELAASGHAELTGRYDAISERLDDEMILEPDEVGLADDGFLGGRGGVLAVAQRVRHDEARSELLLELVREHATSPANDLFYGAPGTMIVAVAEHERTGDGRFADAWRESAALVLDAWNDDPDGGAPLWTQRLGARIDRYVGAGHGLVGNVCSLLRGGNLLGRPERQRVEDRAIDALTRLAVVEDGRANWPPLADRPLDLDGIRTQWCHGAPGVVALLGSLAPLNDGWTALLRAGGELVWEAGPLRERAGLCHGTAGNGYALLALAERTGDERWRERARRFAIHAIMQVEATATPWHSLFTGDLGVALFLRACLDDDARFPALAWL